MLEAAPENEGEESDEYRELVEEVSQNPNPIEHRTWFRLLDGVSILDLANEEMVARPAIYDRLRRMVA